MCKRLTTEDFIKRARHISEDDILDNVNYINNQTKIEITCKKHGKYFIRPSDYLNGHRCPECSGVKKMTVITFIERAKQKHGDKYDYSKVNYINSKTKVCIICKEHGEFWQKPNDHLNSNGCPYCYGTHKLTNKEYIVRAKKVHGDKYIYDNLVYNGMNENITVKCPIHGEFVQNANNHLNGCGCPKCAKIITHSKMSEKIFSLLSELFPTIEKEKMFEWLKFKRKLKLDFFIPSHNIAVEVQGEQHFQPVKKFGGEREFTVQQQRDLIKKELCEKHGIKLFYITKRNFNIDKIKEYLNETTNKKNAANEENKH